MHRPAHRVIPAALLAGLLLASLPAAASLPPPLAKTVDAVGVHLDRPDPAAVAAFEASWVGRALRAQDRLDDGEPLVNTLIPHTHNSANATAYPLSLSSLDPNQRYSITDQLRMGSRGIELDLHWAPHPSGTAATGGRAVVLCHGEPIALGW